MPRLVPLPSRAARRSRLAAAAPGAVALALVLGACSSSDDLGGKVVSDGLGCTVTDVERSSDAPKVEAGTKVGKKTSTTDVKKAQAKACAADSSKYLTIDLVGATADDAKQFTSTFGTDRPITARLGQNQLIPGLETGLTGMKVGARRQIVVPAAEAYGATGNAAQGIGKDEDLVFIADLVSLTDSPVYCNEATNIPKGTREGKPTTIDMPVKAPTKTKATVLEEGDGPAATKKSYVTVDYVGVSCGNGQQFDSSWDREEPIHVALEGATPTQTAFQVIPGWSEGLVGQKEGSLVQIDIPFDKAYGTEGNPPAIGPSDPLTFVVKIVDVSDEPPADPTTTTAAGGATTTVPAG